MSTCDLSESEGAVMMFLRQRIADRTKLGLDDVGPNTKLADTGLQSIDAVLVCGEVEDKFGIELDAAEIFEHESLSTFAPLIARIVDQAA